LGRWAAILRQSPIPLALSATLGDESVLARHAPCHDLIIIDEIGFAPLNDTGAQVQSRLVTAAYERCSLVIASH
jgi:hypothetical protein